MTDTLQTSCHLALPAAALKAVVLRLSSFGWRRRRRPDVCCSAGLL